MTPRLHGDAAYLMFMFTILWYMLLRTKPNVWCLFVAACAFEATINLVPYAF
jgi:hypothetical protein